MPVPNQKQRSVGIHSFAMNPASDVPRSQFDLSHGRTVPFNFSDLVPIFCRPTMPGDTWNCRIQVAARTAVPIKPIQDNWHLEFFAFNLPNRLVWSNAQKFFGEQDNPGDGIAYTIPQTNTVSGGCPVGSLWDHLGLPTVGQCGQNLLVNALPLRGCYKIWNDWFRDENLQNSLTFSMGDGPDTINSYFLQQRGKRFDYFNQALPWPQKGNTAVPLPIGGSATIKTNATALFTGAQNPILFNRAATGAAPSGSTAFGVGGTANQMGDATGGGTFQNAVYPSNLFADLALATGPTLNAFRTAVATQQYLEKDARGGTRYNEFVWNHYKVRTQDARLNRPEFIGGGRAPILTTAIPQTSATGLTGGTTPIGDLAASGFSTGNAGFTYSATEHGYIYVFVSARADLRYQQGLDRMWTVQTRYDFPVPLLAGLGEQAVLNKEIYCVGTQAQDDAVFGYVPRWDEYRFIPSQVVGIYKSTAAGSIDYWHSAQRFSSVPTLNSTYIRDDAKTVVQRNFVAGASTLGQQILADFFFNIKCARALPLYGIPGLTRL